MSETMPDSRDDRLYHLIPAIYRMTDARNGYPLQALLRVLAEQVNVVEDDIEQLYENWFVETADDWAVPYIADLIGYRPVLAAGRAGDDRTEEGRQLNQFLVPRREVANTIRYRRRKGTTALLELLAHDVAGWPARAVEFFKLLGWNQNLDHPHFDRARTVDVHDVADLDLVDGPFDPLAHSVDVRRIGSNRTEGRYDIPSVGVFVWRLKPYSVTHTAAHCAESVGPHCWTFSVLGQDAPLFIRPDPEIDPTHIAGELNLPAQVRRLAFDRDKGAYYGPGKSFAIWTDGWPGAPNDGPVPLDAVIPTDLSGWQYVPPLRHVAVDPVLGRLAFPPSQLPKRGVRVTYHYGFSADIGGGEYRRSLTEPTPRVMAMPESGDTDQPPEQPAPPARYEVGKDGLRTIGAALRQWRREDPADAVIELMESAVFVEPIVIELHADQTLQLRAASGARPVIRLLDWQTDLPDALSITMAPGSRLTLDGLLVTGRSVHVSGPEREKPADRQRICASQLVIRHCTLVPGWGIGYDCEPRRPAEPSLELYGVRAKVRIEHSIVGSIQVHENEVTADPLPLTITDSIIDATEPQREAIGAPGYAVAHATLNIRRCTVFGVVDVHAVELAENCIFNDCVNVARRQLGCMRFCYVPPGCRTPRRYRCQPDLVVQAVSAAVADLPKQAAATACEQARVAPQFTSRRYGAPAFGQLGTHCAVEIKRGADDESEMGVFHDLFEPQRRANLTTRLAEFSPAGIDVGVIYAT